MRSPGRGNEAEAMVLAALARLDLDVLVPFGEGHPYDLAVHMTGCRFLRVQCKTAWPRGGCLVFNCRTTDHGRGPQSYLGLADIFGVYFPPSQSVYLVPINAVADHEGRLRLEATRNNQKRRIRFAADYGVDRWTPDSLRELVEDDPPLPDAVVSLA
jgi:PD-(D/E)XK endonuclease